MINSNLRLVHILYMRMGRQLGGWKVDIGYYKDYMMRRMILSMWIFMRMRKRKRMKKREMLMGKQKVITIEARRRRDKAAANLKR